MYLLSVTIQTVSEGLYGSPHTESLAGLGGGSGTDGNVLDDQAVGEFLSLAPDRTCEDQSGDV